MRQLILVSAVAIALSACTTWHVIPVGAGPAPGDQRILSGEYGTHDDARDVRVRLTGGRVQYYRTAAFHGDSLYGFIDRDSVAFPRESVQGIEVRRVSRAKTGALAVGGTLLFATLVAVAVNNSNGTYSGGYLRPARSMR